MSFHSLEKKSQKHSNSNEPVLFFSEKLVDKLIWWIVLIKRPALNSASKILKEMKFMDIDKAPKRRNVISMFT